MAVFHAFIHICAVLAVPRKSTIAFTIETANGIGVRCVAVTIVSLRLAFVIIYAHNTIAGEALLAGAFGAFAAA